MTTVRRWYGLLTRRNHRTFSCRGEYAGRAIFRPRRLSDLKMQLYRAIGHTVELEFAGVGRPGERFAYQNLYREHGRAVWLDHSFVPEEDLVFLTQDDEHQHTVPTSTER